MSKNTPITARVSTGLFNKKKGVTEPLLNVGQAGVHGNNKTKDIPSPSKMKGYSMKASPFKQENKPATETPYSGEKEIQASVTTQGAGSQLVNKGKEKKETVKYTDLPEDIREQAKADNLKKFGTLNPTAAGLTDNTRGTGEFEDDTVTNIPGETKTKLGDLEVKGRRGAVQRWESKSQGRNMKTLSDDISDSQKNIGKYNARLAKHSGKDGKALKGHERRFRNATSNLAESTRNMNASQGQYDTYTRQVAAGAKGSSGDTFGVKTKATGSDLGTKSTTIQKQIQLLETGKIGEAVVKTEGTAPVPKVKKDGKKKTEGTDGALPKKTPDFFKKKTPLKMKYFK